jgi:hypothetical protein
VIGADEPAQPDNSNPAAVAASTPLAITFLPALKRPDRVQACILKPQLRRAALITSQKRQAKGAKRPVPDVAKPG